MDTNYMCTNGLDMDQLFDKGAGTQSFGMYDTAGVDLGRRFLKGSSDFSTGFYVGSTDVARLLSSDAISIKRSNGVWHGVVGGQCNWDAGFKAGFELLDKYDMKKNEFMDLPATEYSGHPIAYRTTVWNAFRVYSLFEYPGTVLDIKFKTTDGGHGGVLEDSHPLCLPQRLRHRWRRRGQGALRRRRRGDHSAGSGPALAVLQRHFLD